MKTGRLYNTFTKNEYIHLFKNHKKYTDFNILGIYRSLLENKKLGIEEKLEIKTLYNTEFAKTYNFLQLKDPMTFLELELLGKQYTKADEDQLFKNIKKNQEKILKEKRIKHRNFGDYSKHNCGIDGCPMNGMMVKQGSGLVEDAMCFSSDRRGFRRGGNDYKSQKYKKERKHKRLLRQELEDLNI